MAEFDFRKLLNFDWRTRENYIAQLANLTVDPETSEKWWAVTSQRFAGSCQGKDVPWDHRV